MKDEQLYSYAFGELSDSELQRIEAELMKDSSSKAEADFLLNLRSDLKGLQEVPEMQLSIERLREAILGQGLKPSKPAFAWGSWLAGSTAVASVFLLMFAASGGVNRLLGRGAEPQLVLGDSKKSGAPVVALNGSKSRSERIFSEVLTAPTVGASKTRASDLFASSNVSSRVESEVPRRVRKAKRKVRFLGNSSSAMTLIALNTLNNSSTKTGDAALTADVSSKKMSGEPIPPSGADSVSGSVTVPDSTIVMINTERDESTGAPIATEVRNPSNVVIGG